MIADSASRGVVDSHHRIFNYKNMYICDGSVVAANLGVNPSLTITALTERAMNFIPLSSRDRLERFRWVSHGIPPPCWALGFSGP